MRRGPKTVLLTVTLITLWAFGASVFAVAYYQGVDEMRVKSVETQIIELGFVPLAVQVHDLNGGVAAHWVDVERERRCMVPVQWERTRAVLGTVSCE